MSDEILDKLVLNKANLQGRKKKAVEVELVRELEPGDLVTLEDNRNPAPVPGLQKIKDSHHHLARSLAAGMRPAEASAVTGYSLSRISILQKDPAFQELLAHYRSAQESAFAELQVRMGMLSLDVIQELQDRIQDAPEEISTGALRDLFIMLADRTGHGPTSTQVSANVHLTPEDMARLNAEAQKQENVTILDISPGDSRPSPSEDSGPGPVPSGEVKGSPSERESVREEDREATSRDEPESNSVLRTVVQLRRQEREGVLSDGPSPDLPESNSDSGVQTDGEPGSS